MKNNIQKLLENKVLWLSVQVTDERLKEAGVTINTDLGIARPKIKPPFLSKKVRRILAGLK